MAPFKFGKKQKNKKDQVSSANTSVIAADSTENTTPNASQHAGLWSPVTQGVLGKQNYPKAADVGSFPSNKQRVSVNPIQQRSASNQSMLQQNSYTPWNRIKLDRSPFPRYRHVASSYASDEDEVFVIGGLHDQSVYGDTWILKSTDDGTKISSATVPITDSTPPPRVGHASTLCGNAFVIFGGDTHKVNDAGLMDDDIYLFNINSHKWTIPSPQGTRPLGRYGHKISIIATNQMKTKLYVFGGQFDETYFNDLAVFDLSSFRRPDSHWEFIKPVSFVPPPLTNHTMVSFDYKLWVFGGDTPQGLSNEVFQFDPYTTDWSVVQTTGTSPPPLQEHAALIYRDLMCVFGGKDSQDNYSQAMYFLNLKTLKWFKLPNFSNMIPRPRSGHSLTLLPNNKILIMGGDKFDYALANSTDLRTSDVDMGAGTIVYTLDLTKLNEFCPGIFDASEPTSVDALTTPVTKNPARFDDAKHRGASILSPDVVASSDTTPIIKKIPEPSVTKPKSPIPPQETVSDPPRVLSLQSHLSSDNGDEMNVEAASPDFADQESLTQHDTVHKSDFGNNGRSSSQYELSPSSDDKLNLSDNHTEGSLVGNKLLDRSIDGLAYSHKSADTLSEPAKIISERNDGMVLKELLVELRQLKEDAVSSADQANKRITELELENAELRQFSKLSHLNDMIKHQNEIISKLQQEINYKEKYQELELKYNHLNEKYATLAKELESKEGFINDNLKKYTESLDSLMNSMKQKHNNNEAASLTRKDTVSGLTEKLNDVMLQNKELSTSRDQMFKEYTKLKDDHSYVANTLSTKHEELQKMEKEYKSIMESVHNSGNALEKLQNEIVKLRQENSRLKTESEHHNDSVDYDESSGSLNDAHYQLKIKDLRAELFLIKQERDSLKDDLLHAKKKLLNYDPL